MTRVYAALMLTLFMAGCGLLNRSNTNPGAQKNVGINNPFFAKPMNLSFDRGEFLAAMNRLDQYYSSAQGLARPQGLSLNGRPDFEGIAAWIFDIYLTSRSAGQSVEQSWQNVVAAIENTDEWKAKHPGQAPRPAAPPAQTNLNRAEFLLAMQRLDDYYKQVEGLQRPQGLSLNGRPDFEGIAAWIFDIYLTHRARGADSEVSWLWVVYSIQHTAEWQHKHPGQPAIEKPGERLRLPNHLSVLMDIYYQTNLIQQSCVETGGNNSFLHEAMRRLRKIDRRYGLNWKRGIVGDMSQDVLTYYYGPGEPQEGSTQVYVVDIIVGHCGHNPKPLWDDVSSYGIGRWTLGNCPNYCN